MKHIKLLVPADLSFSSGVREIALEASNAVGFGKKQKNMFRLVVDELFMNAIRYGSNKESNVFIEFVIDKNKIIAAVEDEGKGVKKISANELTDIINKEKNNTSLNKCHGRGLAQITSQLVSAFEVHDKKTGWLRVEFIVEINELLETIVDKKEKKIDEKILMQETIVFKWVMDLIATNNNREKVNQVLSKYKDIPIRVLFDVTDLEYCVSTFLWLLATWQSFIDKSGGECVLLNPNETILEIFDLVGLLNIFTVKYDNNHKKIN